MTGSVSIIIITPTEMITLSPSCTQRQLPPGQWWIKTAITIGQQPFHDGGNSKFISVGKYLCPFSRPINYTLPKTKN